MADATRPDEALLYRLAHLRRPGFLRGFSVRQVVVAIGGAALVVLDLRWSAGPVAARIALLIAGVLVVVVGLGRVPGGDLLLDLLGPVTRHLGRYLSRHRRWAASLSVLGSAPSSTPPLLAGLVLHDLDPLECLGRPGRRVGVIEDRSDGSVSLVLGVHGEGFALADARDKDARIAGLAAALASCCVERGPVVRVTWSQWSSPASLAGHRSWLAASSRSDPVKAVASSYEEVLEVVERAATRTEVLVSVSVAKSRVRVLAHHRGDRLLAASEALLDAARMLSLQLERAGLVVTPPLSVHEVARSYRTRLDPACARFLEARGHSLGELAGVVSADNAFPLVIEESRDRVRVDESLHKVFRVAEWPRSAVRADWLFEMLGGLGAIRGLSVVFVPQSRTRARFELDAEATRLQASLVEHHERLRRVGASTQRSAEAIEQLDSELDAGAGMLGVLGLVVVSARSSDELEQSVEATRQRGANAGIELRLLSYRQGAALVAGLGLGRGVAEGARR